MPVEPPPSRWALPSAEHAADTEIAGVGADLAPGTLLAAYRQGLFPMRLQSRGPIGLGPLAWWSPDPRGIIPLDGLLVSGSLRKSVRRFEVRVDTAFEAVERDRFFGVPVVACTEFSLPTLTSVGLTAEKT